MTRYRVTLTIHETGNEISKEDFRKLQEAVDTISKVTDLTIAIEGNPASIATTIWHAGDQPMETGKHNPDFERWPHNVTIKDIYGQE